jgi:SsrA-binding protein
MNRIIAKNPTAFHNYTIEDRFEAGIVLSGTEIKSIRNGNVNIKDSYIIIKNGEMWILGMHIKPYEFGNINNKDPLRDRKILVHKSEINKLLGKIKQKGVSLVPLNLYWNKNHVKIEVGIGKGKKLYDKREDLKRKDAERTIERHTKYDLR